MPAITLVVCLRNETANLARLLRHSSECFDELLVVHDGAETVPSLQKTIVRCGPGSLERAGAPPSHMAMDYATLKKGAKGPEGYRLVTGHRGKGSLGKLVASYRGRLYEGPRCFQQEPHWPFAWWQARHEWILRLDADEYPSEEMKAWLLGFRKTSSVTKNLSGFSCVWPYWDGEREFCFSESEWRPFLIHKHRASLIGMAEQGPIPHSPWKKTGLVLHHRPERPSFGLSYVFFRRQSYRWRRCIAASLALRPVDLPRWQYNRKTWPAHWAQVIARPWATGLRRWVTVLFANVFLAPRRGIKFCQSELLGTPFHQLSISWAYGFYRLLG